MVYHEKLKTKFKNHKINPKRKKKTSTIIINFHYYKTKVRYINSMFLYNR